MLTWFKKKPAPKAFIPPAPKPANGNDKCLMTAQSEYFLRHRRSPKVIFDVGANVGDLSLRYAEIFPEAQVFAFEPCSETYSQLVERCRSNGCIHPVQAALSYESGESEFFTYRNSAVNSLLPIYEDSLVDSPEDVKDKFVCTVETETIDGFMRKHAIDDIDILKLDVQGGEVRTLQGATQALAEQRIGAIVSEMNFCSVYESQAWFFDVAKMLHDYHYEIWDLYGCAYADSGKLKWGDAIFFPSRAAQS